MHFRTQSFTKTFSLLLLTLTLLLGASCAHVHVQNSSPGKSGSAPGQVKKTTGSQSAKPYAPGQQKKKKN